jgi:HK97 family phage major capsid protein
MACLCARARSRANDTGVRGAPIQSRAEKSNKMTPQEKRQINEAIVEANVELDSLSKKPSLSGQEKRRSEFLLSRLANLRAGFGLRQVMASELHTLETEHGLEHAEIKQPDSLSDEQRAFCQFLKTGEVERRDEVSGIPIAPNSFSGGNGGGSFVPVDFFTDFLPMALKAHDPIFDEDSVTLIKTENGRPISVPFLSDTENVAVLTSELADTSSAETDIASAGQVLLGAYSYRSPIFRTSIESVQDTENAFPVVEIFKAFAADRIARGVSKDMLLGSSKTAGLLPSLLALPFGVGAIASGGSAVNDGGSGTSSTSINSQDLSTLFFSVNSSYRDSDKCAWWMNDSTLLALSKQNDKQGRPLIDLNAPRLQLMGKPVKVSPSMPSIGASTNPIAFGDFTFWAQRLSIGTGYIKRYINAPGLAENFKCGFRAFSRHDGALLFSDQNSAPPIRLLQMHS